MTTTRVSLREELIFLLNEATELEHSLCCSYLFTAFSLRSNAEDGLTEAQVEATRRWKRAFSDVAIEEMFHLAMINNLLVAVGSAPNLDRPNFPHDCAYYMPGVQIELRPFSEETVRQFVAVEQPAGGTLPVTIEPELLQHVQGDLVNEIGPDPYSLSSQGDVYGLVLSGLRDMASRLGEKGLFIGPPATEALRSFLGYNGWQPIHDIASAERALSRIVEQGEGGSADSDASHHRKFSAILNEFLEMKAADQSFEPAFPVLHNPFTRTPPEANGPVNLISDEFAIQVSDLFNEVYGALLQVTARFFITTEESETEAAALGDAAVEAMEGAVLPLGELLVRQPAGEGHGGLHAGPSFVVRTLHPLPHKQAAWALLRERFGELRDYCAHLASLRSSADTLSSVSESLGRVVKALS